jgi:hypothetical protein
MLIGHVASNGNITVNGELEKYTKWSWPILRYCPTFAYNDCGKSMGNTK